MKFLKKALIISMVICVLCSVCLLPVSADVVDGVWDDAIAVDTLGGDVVVVDGYGGNPIEVDLDNYYCYRFVGVRTTATASSYDMGLYAPNYGESILFDGSRYAAISGFLLRVVDNKLQIYANFTTPTGVNSGSTGWISAENVSLYLIGYPPPFPSPELESSYLGAWQRFVFTVEYVVKKNTADNLTDVWTSVFAWVTGSLTLATSAFFADGELTLLGALAIMVLSIGLAWLLVGIIQKFLRLRG